MAWHGFFAPLIIYAALFALHVALPARRVDGYVRDPSSGAPLRYRLNGLLVLVVACAAWVGLGWADLVPWNYLYLVRWESLAGACVIGLAFSFAIVGVGEPRRGYLADFYLGRLDNPQFLGGRVDAKMILYLIGAVMLELHVLSFAAHHVLTFPDRIAPGVLLHAALLTWFVIDYLTFERVHLYTYDLFAERVGFKLGWGCLAFYPYFYPVGLWAFAGRPDPAAHPALLVVAAIVFFGGWTLARGANMQKYAFKRHPERAFLGFMRPVTLSDGRHTLLCSGFWGISRHVNYLGEIGMAVGLALALGDPTSPWPWLYPLYYVALLFPRERDDDRRCAEKYGELWERYRQRVPRRIVPGVY